ncbi:hypothetical protein G210_0261 [Candida maltosa Xu316]|uniref:AB hydrolase-1 domain-containing protein n=1 Tax=Candida maltosa (strain Xu316) TaxID=1245528 RepID=M3K2V5_CANMX|nr:hypothetical protein G210_0261 [Candida maltosa Xu316]
MTRYQVKLHNGTRSFSTISNFPEDVIKSGKWDRAIFLLHGFPDVNTTFDKAWPDLEASAFPTEKVLLLAPKLRGYEKSSIGPEAEYSLPHVASDVKAWIQEINPDNKKPIHLLGHDWGALVSFKAANMFPELITSMVTLAIPYIANLHIWDLLWYAPEQIYLSSYFLTMQLGSIYRPKLTQNNDYLGYLWKYWSPSYNYTTEEIDEIRETFSKDGVVDAVTSYYRHILNPVSLVKSRWLVDFNKVPTLIMVGEEDGCMSKRIAELEEIKLKKYPDAHVKILPNAGHFLQREQPEIVAKISAEFFERYSKL